MANKRRRIEVAGSKSIMARVLCIAGFGDVPVRFDNPADCVDSDELLRALVQLGATYRRYDNSIELTPATYFPVSAIELHFEGSATAFRFMVAQLAVRKGIRAVIRLGEQLRKRPHNELLEAFPNVRWSNDDGIIEVIGEDIHELRLKSSGAISSQYVSAMMLAAPLTYEGFRIDLTEDQVSLPYIEMTSETLKSYGIRTILDGQHLQVPGRQAFDKRTRVRIEPDASTAAFWLTAGSISKLPLWIEYPPHDSIQGDTGFLHVLQAMGAEITRTKDFVMVEAQRLNGIDIDMRGMPDCVPMLAVLSLTAESPTVIKGIEHLRWKESDRVERLVSQIRRIGGSISYDGVEMTIQPLRVAPKETVIETGSDHRIAMAFIALSLRFPQITIDDRKCVDKSLRNIGFVERMFM